MARKLTSKQASYKNNRIKGMDPCEAYRNSEYSSCNMSAASINKEAQKLENHPIIAPLLIEAREEAHSASIMTRDEALQRLTLHARIKITDICDFSLKQIGTEENGDPVMQTVWSIKNSEDIPPEVAACIKSVSVGKDGPKVELYDSDGAIKQLSTMQGWDAKKQLELTGLVGVANMSTDDYKKARSEMMKDDDC